MMDDPTRRENQFQEPLDRWLREQKPPTPESEDDLARLRTSVKEGVREARRARRRRLTARGAMVAAVLLVGFTALDFRDTGSDGFEMVEVEGELTPRVLKNEFRGTGMNKMEGTSEAEDDELNRLATARAGEVVEVMGTKVDDQPVFWNVKRRYVLSSGRAFVLGHPAQTPRFVPPQEMVKFLVLEFLPLEDKILSGELPTEKGSLRVTVDGVEFDCRTWSLDLEGRRVTYILGEPGSR